MKTFNEYSKEFDELDEVLSIAQRAARAKMLKRNQAKIKRGKKIKQRKLATKETLKGRSEKLARNQFAKKLSGGKSKSELGFAQRRAIEMQLKRKGGAIKKMAKRLFPTVRKAEVERLAKFKEAEK